MKDLHFWSIGDDEPSSHTGDELFRLLSEAPWEAIDAEVEGGEGLNIGVVSEDTQVGSGSQGGDAVDEFDVVGFEEDQIGCDFKRQCNCSHSFSI